MGNTDGEAETRQKRTVARRTARKTVCATFCLAAALSPLSATMQTTAARPTAFVLRPSRRSVVGNGPGSNALQRISVDRATEVGRRIPVEGRQATALSSFMGTDGGILGVGTPELITILLVGYFVLGPSDLYKLVKEIGKFVQNLRTFTTEATSSFENTMESNLQLEEIRKAQRELNDAFSFRRSINVDQDSEAFSVNAKSERIGDTGIGATTTNAAVSGTVSEAVANAQASGKKKKIRRRVRKTEPGTDLPPPATNIPQDLDMATAFDPAPTVTNTQSSSTKPMNDNAATAASDAVTQKEAEEDARAMSELEKARAELLAERNALEQKRQEQEAKDDAVEIQSLRDERMARLRGETPSAENTAADRELASTADYDLSTDESAAASRFQAQLSGSWNDQIIAKTDELQPLAAVMNQLALLEQEKNAADARLEEEYRKRAENEEKYYREKRALLEQAAQQIQQADYAALSDPVAATNSTASVATK